MKIALGEQHVKGSHGLTEQGGFAIRANAHAFKLLSSGLYSDKIKAVLQEIGCNATDAHIEYGTPDRPIEVKLPNRIDNQFYIRDWGPGLSHEDVLSLYTTYFASTKQESNDVTGAFGLGSKSPFSYVDSFTVTSVHGGKKRTYTMHLDNMGSPGRALLATEDADPEWKHGVMVSFAVKPGDYVYFAQKAQAVYQWFRTSPKIVGAEQIKPITPLFDSDKFMRVEAGQPLSGIIMGNVFYPLDINKLEGASPKALAFGLIKGLVLKVPIGAVQVAASREALQYDKPSMAYLIERCEEAVEHIAKDLEIEAANFEKASWEEKCKVTSLSAIWVGNAHFDWGGFFTAAGRQHAANTVRIINARYVDMPAAAGAKAKCRLVERTWRMSATKSTVIAYGQSGPADNRSTEHVKLDAATYIYYGRAKHSVARVKALLLDAKITRAIVVTPLNAAQPADVCKKEAYEISAKLSGMKVIDVSTLPIPPIVARSTPTGPKNKKPKGFAQAPIPSRIVQVLYGPVRMLTPMDISKLPPADQHFMCSTPHYGWSSNDDGIRLFANTADTDKVMSSNAWLDMWKDFQSLQQTLGIRSSTQCPILSAAEIRALDLVKRGWPLSINVIKDWLEAPATRDAVSALAGKWRPTVNLGQTAGWTGELIDMLGYNRPAYDQLAPAIGMLSDDIIDIYNASIKAGAQAGQNQPPVIRLYERLSQALAVQPLPKFGTRDFLTVADLERRLIAKFPLLSVLHEEVLKQTIATHPAKLADLAKLLFT